MRSIWAVAVNTIKQALRMKIVVVFVLLLIVLLPLMSIAMTADGTVKGRLQTFVSYSLSLTAFLLCLLTIVVSIYSLTNDIKYRQIYTVLTKPIRRFQFLFGKLLGVILLNVSLLVLFSVLIYAITINMPKFFKLGDAELYQLDNEFFTARAGLVPEEVDVSDEVAQAYSELKKAGKLPRGITRNRALQKKIIAELTMDKRRDKRSAVPGQELLWQFHNVKPLGPDQSLFIRFKYDVSRNPLDLNVYGRWEVGDYRQVQYGTKLRTPIYRFDRKEVIRTFHEIEVPADAVAEDGYLAVRFLNVPLNNTVVIFAPKDGLEVLYKADTFGANFIRAVILILFRLFFLACLSILASTFLSFPVAILLCLVVLFTGTISGFIIESFDSLGENTGVIYSYTIKWFIQLLPQFDKINPAKFLVPARILSWSLLAKTVAVMICIKSLLLLLAALLIFHFKEVAKITV